MSDTKFRAQVDALIEALMPNPTAARLQALNMAVAHTMSAISRGENVIIRVEQRGTGIINDLNDALAAANITNTIYAADAVDHMDIVGIPVPDFATGEVRQTEPFFVRSFAEDKVIVLDEIQATPPSVGEFIRSQGQRGRLVLIFRGDFGYNDYVDFPASRVTIA